MATPSSPREDEIPDYPSCAEKTYTSDSKNSLKRTRETLEDNFDDVMWDLTDDGRPKTRRVNPQRLAIRLGPDLVAEMEAHIVPGAKMPTFSVRKDFQERYSVDRRHIYDYFHSRGLRVAKEDKHTNLIRGRALKAQAQAQATPKPIITAVKEESSLCEALRTRPFLAHVVPPSKPRGRVPKKSVKSQEKKSRVIGQSPKTLSKSKKALPDFYIPPQTSREEVSSEAEAILSASSSGTETDWESSLPCPEFSLPCNTPDDNAGRASDVSDFLTMPDNFVADYFDSPVQAQLPFLDVETSPLDPDPYTAVDRDILTEAERTELYNLIDTNIPLALEQSVGTYQSFMDERSQSYFDLLLPVSRRSRSSRATTNITKAVASDSASPLDLPDIRKWLSDDLDLYQNCAMDAYDFNPVRDDIDRNNVNDMTSSNGRGTTRGLYYPEPLQSQSQNLPCFVEVDKTIPRIDKKNIKCENKNPNPI